MIKNVNIVHFYSLLQGEVQYFIGVQLDGSEHVGPLQNSITEDTVKENEHLVSIPSESVVVTL